MISISIIVVCAFIISKIAQKNFPLDPGSIHIYVFAFANTSMLLLHSLWYFQFINDHQWLLWSEEGMFKKVLTINVIYVLVFTLSYLILIKLFKIKDVYNKANNFQYPTNNFILIYLITVSILIILEVMSLNYYVAYMGQIPELAMLIAGALLLSRIKNDYILFIGFFYYIAFTILVMSPLSSASEGYVINRGGAISTVLFTVVFIDVVKERNLLTKKRVNLSLLFLPIILGGVNFIEEIINMGQVNFYQLFIYVLEGYELRMMENQAVIIDSIESNQMYGLGNTYLLAFADIIFPFLNLNLSPGVWLAGYIDGDSDGSARFGMSTIAEGMMNFPVYGPVIAAIINAFILFFLRCLYYSNRYYGPILFSALVALPYYLYRSDINYVMKKIEFAILSTIAVLILLKMINLLNLTKKRS